MLHHAGRTGAHAIRPGSQYGVLRRHSGSFVAAPHLLRTRTTHLYPPLTTALHPPPPAPLPAPQIIALSVGANRLDADNFKGDSPCTEVVVSNQASKLATATGGVFKNGVVVNTIVQVGVAGMPAASTPAVFIRAIGVVLLASSCAWLRLPLDRRPSLTR